MPDLAAGAGQPVWLYRFSYVAESARSQLKGTLHSFEIPYTYDIPGALVRDKVTKADMAAASGYWLSFGTTGDPSGERQPQCPRHGPGVDWTCSEKVESFS